MRVGCCVFDVVVVLGSNVFADGPGPEELANMDAVLTSLTLVACMLVGWGMGWFVGRRVSEEERKAPPNSFNVACLSLHGLMLAFVLALSVQRYDERRQMVVADSNAIGDFYTCAGLANEPVRQKLLAAIRAYAELLLATGRTGVDDTKLEELLGEVQVHHRRMQDLVTEAVGAGSPVPMVLVNTFNELTSHHASRLSALRAGLPGSVVVLLFVSSIIAMVRMGRQQGATGERERPAMLSYVAVVGILVWVILDLNEPRCGLITVSQEPMVRLLAGMGK